MLETTTAQNSEYVQPASQADVKITVTCSICGAIYAPSRARPRLQYAPASVVESAFLSTCRFCFRCRRPACSQCWDAVHGVCGACDEEARLPFRMELAPLDGVQFPPPSPLPVSQDGTGVSPFVCVQQGRFQYAAPHINTISDLSTVHIATVEPTTEPAEALQGALEIKDQPRKTELLTEDVPLKPDTGVVRVMERIFTVVTLVVLLTVVLLILLAEFAPGANAGIIRLLHVDIQAEIAYVVHLVHMLH